MKKYFILHRSLNRYVHVSTQRTLILKSTQSDANWFSVKAARNAVITGALPTHDLLFIPPGGGVGLKWEQLPQS